MLSIVTRSGTSLVDPSSLKDPLSSFPVSSSLECSANAWSPDNSQLYLASSTSIKRYTLSEGLLEEVYSGSNPVTCLAVKAGSNTVFFAAANKVWSVDCARSPGKACSSLEPHKSPVTTISMSNDGTLLASASTSAVLVHNLTLSSHTPLRGLPDGTVVTCCMFHQHSRTRLLLGVGREVAIYDSTRPSGPLRLIRIPGGSSGNIVSMADSPFSKSLVAAATSNGDIALVDLDKDNGILKSVNVQTSLTSCAFTAEGAAIYLGTENGKLMILDLRALEKEPKSVIIGDGDSPIKAINVQKKAKSNPAETKVKSALATAKKTPPELLEPRTSARVPCVSSSPARARCKAGTIGAGVKSPVRVTVASKLRGGSGVTPRKKLFSQVRSPLTDNKNLGLDAQLSNYRSPTSSRDFETLRLEKDEEINEMKTRSSVMSRKSTEQVNAPHFSKRIPSSLNKPGKDAKGRLAVESGPSESISGHFARMRSGSILDGGPKEAGQISSTRRVISESHSGSSTRQRVTRLTSSATAGSRVSSKLSPQVVSGTQRKEQRSATPDNDEDRPNMSPPDLPRDPVTPISLGKNRRKAPMTTMTSAGMGVVGFGSPEVVRWAKGDTCKEKEKEKEVGVKKARFLRHQGTAESDRESDDNQAGTDFESPANEERDNAREQELSMQVSPRRPTAPSTWLPSPHRPSAANLNMNAAAQDFLRNIVRDVMYDFQRETKAEMVGLHLDLVRMGRGWRRELREVLEESGGEIQQLKEENKRLREENERLRRGH
ncbi:hypothetical protein PAXRUDRAFT_830066 [Paxillus rubicundulus Ve08.2h10]|uniref:WD40 repeat-like protein n=1 Tax=Paxillus rubicundulus Ve08.2h10 TaxID=930991 RepID=A0A0D0D689_9AGAM|nr:hypothetical protein PAXRUDRAFT_830066 [Paxillus rubicundulus Ve08.2h10]